MAKLFITLNFIFLSSFFLAVDNLDISESSELNESLSTSTTTLSDTMSEPEVDEVVDSAVATSAGNTTAVTGNVAATTGNVAAVTGNAAAVAAAVAAAEKESNERVKLLTDKLVDLEAELQESKTNFESIKEANSAINVELTVAQEQLCESLKLLDEKCRMLEEIEVQKIKTLAGINSH